MKVIDYIVSEIDEGSRIDIFISKKCDYMSRSHVQKLIKDSNVLVNDKCVKSNYKIKKNDYIKINIPDLKESEIFPENIKLDIIFEDDDLIILNKQKGIVVHPSCGHSQGTLVNALLYKYKDKLSGINGVMRPGIVHRLDKDTSGLMIVCKNDFSHVRISNQLSKHLINRTYHAIAKGHIKNKEGRIETLIARDPKNRKRMKVVKNNGKIAITNYKVITYLKKNTYLKCNLETGRTHQIRVHMNYINHILLGDKTYGYKGNICKKYNIEGQVLHSKSLKFIHPRNNKYVEFDVELPEYFKNILENEKI